MVTDLKRILKVQDLETAHLEKVLKAENKPEKTADHKPIFLLD
jgi:hypothetical protein